MTPNERAFLFTIAISELGPLILARSDDGYNVIVGSTPDKLDLMTTYADHPRKSVPLAKLGIRSTAAGRYQILARYYDAYKRILGLPDFSPASQDKIALQLIAECSALGDINAGQIESALKKCRSRWASLPGAGYGQHENKLSDLVRTFKQAGGVTA